MAEHWNELSETIIKYAFFEKLHVLKKSGTITLFTGLSESKV